MKKQLATLGVLSVMTMGCAHAVDIDFTSLVRPNSVAAADAISGDHMVSDAPCDDEAMAPSDGEVAQSGDSAIKKDVENAYDKAKTGTEKAGKNIKEGAEKAGKGIKEGAEKAGSGAKNEMHKMEDKMKKHRNDSSCK